MFCVHGSQISASQPSCHVLLGCSWFACSLNVMGVLLPQFVHKALAHELLSLQGGPSSGYYLALAQTYLLKEELSKCEECLCEAVRIDCMVTQCVITCLLSSPTQTSFLSGDASPCSICLSFPFERVEPLSVGQALFHEKQGCYSTVVKWLWRVGRMEGRLNGRQGGSLQS